MPKFRVMVREVHIQGYLVEAKDEEEAIKKVRYDSGLEHDGIDMDEAHFEFSHRLDPSLWSAEEEEADPWEDKNA
ncbi:MAG: hypothetical protein ACXABY_02565 [Candidatus Thorarchaeota archaeon]|jgi:hypothetical protein